MNKEFNITTAKMRSLMERIEKPHTKYQALLNEKKMINEVTGAKKAVTRDEIVDILNQQDDMGNGGKFAYVVYATGEPIYQTKRSGSWRPDDVNTMLDQTRDEHGETDWHKDLSSYNDPSVKNSTKNPITALCVTKYRVHWQTEKNFKLAYSQYADDLHNLRMSHGIGLQSDGMLGDNMNQRQKADNGTQFNQNGKLSKDFNMASAEVAERLYYRVNADGNICGQVPEAAIKAMSAPYKPKGPEKSVAAVISGEELDAYMKAKKELDKKFRAKTLNFDGMVAISANVNGVSYYYINDRVELSGKRAFPINPEDVIKIGEELIGQSFVPMTGFEN